MKQRLTFLFAFALLMSTGLKAQISAEWIYPSNTGNDFDDVEFVNENVGVAITYGGAIVSTSDGGETWKASEALTYENLTDISWVNETVVAVGGNNGTVLISGDAGATWTKKYIGFNMNIRAIQFTSATTGYVVGNRNLIYKTMDGGDTWEALDFENSTFDFTTGETYYPSINSIYFMDENKGWIAGDKYTAAFTLDGGESWTQSAMAPDLSIALPNLYAVYFSDASNGYIVGQTGTTLKSTDGGLSWAIATSSIGADLLNIVAGPSSLWATCTDANGVVYSSMDNGATWDVGVTTGPFVRVLNTDGDSIVRDGYSNGRINDIAFAGTKMVAVGLGGEMSTSMDNGATWAGPKNDFFQYQLWIQNLGFSADKQIVYAGTNGSKNYAFTGNHLNSHMYKSTDGGLTWEHKPAFNWGGASNSPVTGVMVNPNNPDHVMVVGRKRAQWTRDGGETWYNSNDLYINEDSVAIKGGSGLPGVDHFSAQWVDDSVVYVISSGYIQKSSDSAKTWTRIWDRDVDTLINLPLYNGTTKILAGTAWVDRMTGYVSTRAVGMMKTIDGGKSWINLSDSLQTVCPFGAKNNMGAIAIDPSNPNNIAVVYNNRGVATSSDAGMSFIYTQLGGTYSCNDVTYVGPGILWSTGKAPAVSFNNGKTWQYRGVNGISNLKQTDDMYIVDENTIYESGAVASTRQASSIVKYTFPTGYFTSEIEQAKNITFSNLNDSTKFTVDWTRGNGDGCAVFIRIMDTSAIADVVPDLNMFGDVLPNAAFGKGQRSRDGWFCIYSGTESTVNVTELPLDTTYTVFVAEYKNGYLFNLNEADGNHANSPAFTVGINNVEALTAFNVYPNPTEGELVVSATPEKPGVGTVTVISLVGKIVDQKTMMFHEGTNTMAYDISDYSSGMYFVKVEIDGNASVKRIIKK